VIANEEPFEDFTEDIVVSEDDKLIPAKRQRVNGNGNGKGHAVPG
jgi:hypothetical protein